MIRDEDLKQAIDYSEGQKTAAYMVLGEIVNLLNELYKKLDEKFASSEHMGPADVVAFMRVTDKEEKERIKQDVYQKVQYLVHKLRIDK